MPTRLRMSFTCALATSSSPASAAASARLSLISASRKNFQGAASTLLSVASTSGSDVFPVIVTGARKAALAGLVADPVLAPTKVSDGAQFPAPQNLIAVADDASLHARIAGSRIGIVGIISQIQRFLVVVGCLGGRIGIGKVQQRFGHGSVGVQHFIGHRPSPESARRRHGSYC